MLLALALALVNDLQGVLDLGALAEALADHGEVAVADDVAHDILAGDLAGADALLRTMHDIGVVPVGAGGAGVAGIVVSRSGGGGRAVLPGLCLPGTPEVGRLAAGDELAPGGLGAGVGVFLVLGIQLGAL